MKKIDFTKARANLSQIVTEVFTENIPVVIMKREIPLVTIMRYEETNQPKIVIGETQKNKINKNVFGMWKKQYGKISTLKLADKLIKKAWKYQ